MKEIKLDCLTFEIYDDNTAAVTECEKDATDVVIPRYVEGSIVKSIGDRAFENCARLKTVVLPDIAEGEFYGDDSFEEIGENAFLGCTSLEEITLPFSVMNVGHGAFYDCTALETVTFDCPADFIPHLAPYTFIGCKSLKKVTPAPMLNDGMFSGCTMLEYLPISESCAEIPEDCFEHCDSLTEITIPKSVKSIGPLAFRGCSNLTHVHFEDPEGWTVGSVYFPDREPKKLDLTDPIKNAKWLCGMDFDDGVSGIKKR